MEKNIMPILGFDNNVFAYTTEMSAYCGPETYIHFCNQEGGNINVHIDEYLVLSVHEHFYSTEISSKTTKIIIVESNNNGINKLVNIGGSHIKKHSILDCKFLSEGVIVTSKELLSPIDNRESVCFHPASKLNLQDTPRCLFKTRDSVSFHPNTFYLFSIHNIHFFVKISTEQIKEPTKFKYLLLDEYGNKIKEYNESEMLKLVWVREDESFTIFSVDNDITDHIVYNRFSTEDESSLCRLSLFNMKKEYFDYSYTDYKKEIEESNAKRIHNHRDEYENTLIPTFNGYILERAKYYEINYRILPKKCLSGFELNNGDFCFGEYKLYLREVFFDNKYLIGVYDTGYCVFDKSSLIANNDFQQRIQIDRSSFEEYDYDPSIELRQYGNGLVGLRLYKGHKEYDEDGELCPVYYKIGKYRIYDLYGNNVGEIRDGIFYTPVSESGVLQHCGILSLNNFEMIIPPMFQKIEKLITYEHIIYNPKSTFPRILPESERKEAKDIYDRTTEYLKIDFFGNKIIDEVCLYIASLESSNNNRILTALYKNNTELLPLGENDIQKKNERYVLARTINDKHYTLYYYNGVVLSNNVIDMEVNCLYDVKCASKSVYHGQPSIVLNIIYSYVYFEGGFKLLVDDSFVVEDLLTNVEIVKYCENDIFFMAESYNGNFGLLSLKNGWLFSSETMSVTYNIDFLFNTEKKRMPSIYEIFHITKVGVSLTNSELKKICSDLWGYCDGQQPYSRFALDKIVLSEECGKYKLLPKDVLSTKEIENADYLKIIDTVSFVGEEVGSFEHNLLKISTENDLLGIYSISEQWLIKPKKITNFRHYNNYVVVDESIIVTKNGIKFEGEELEFIADKYNISAFKIKSNNKFLIIDEDGDVYTCLYELRPNIFANNELENYNEYQIVLDTMNKSIEINHNKSYNHYCEQDNGCGVCEWTDEDSWDAMTDGQYGDYPGSGWDSEMFGY